MTMKVFKIHAQSYRDRMEREMRIRDEAAWLNGRYVANAIGAAFSKQGKYPEKPLLTDIELSKTELSEEEKRIQSEALFTNLALLQTNFNLTHNNEPTE